MNRLFFFIIFSFWISKDLSAQSAEEYSELIKEAWALYESEDYLKSAQKYSEAFVAFGNRGVVSDRYNVACSWALAGKPNSAFVQLFKIAEKGNYSNVNHLLTDSDLKSLHKDERFGKIAEIVAENREKAEAHLDKELVSILDTIYIDDQKYRKQIDEIEEKHGRQSDEIREHWKLIGVKDSINLLKVKKILDERGWLGPDSIGRQGSSTLFLVIQHSDLETQEHYLPMMREAVEKGNARGSSLALLEDRVALRKEEKQIYGSQIGRDNETGEYYVLPLINPENVDERRASVGLGPLRDYVSRWGMTWDAEEYKKQLPEIEAKQK